MTVLEMNSAKNHEVYTRSNANNKTLLSVPENLINFLENHIVDIEQMYESKAPLGYWKKLGKGISKIAFTHPDLPGRLIKIPASKYVHRGWTGDDDLRIHHANLQKIRSRAALFDRIVLPESYLYPTSKGLIIVEQKLDLLPYEEVPNGPEKTEAMKQFYKFKEVANLCDLNPKSNLNAGIVSSLSHIKVGVFDFDCTRFSKEMETILLLAAIIPLAAFIWNAT